MPQDFYTLQVLKAELKEATYKQTTKTHNAGDTCEFIKFQFVVKNHPEYTGRRIFVTLFFGARELRALRKLMDVTGVQQTPGSMLSEWLQMLTEIQPEFKAQVTNEDDVDYSGKGRTFERDGTTIAKINKVNWKELLPVD